MNKQELINKVTEKCDKDLTKATVSSVLTTALDVIGDTLSEGEKVSLIGFGTFEVRDRAARKGRNPQTGEEIQIPASKAPAFRAGKTLKDKVK